MKHHRLNNLFLMIVLLALASLACSALGGGEEEAPAAQPPDGPAIQVEAPTQTPVIIIATPTPGEEQPPAADVPELAAPTAEPGQPTMTALVDLNVRQGPGTNYFVVGALRAGSSARIVGRSPDNGWWKIECPPGGGSECWSSALPRFSSATDSDGVPVAAVPPPPPPPHTPTATATVMATGTTQATATIDGTVTVTTTPTTTPTPTATQEGGATATPSPTPTKAAGFTAPFDNDSLQNPAVSHFLSPTGTRDFTFNQQLSYEDGDQEDWVEFEFPNNDNSSQPVWVTLDCALFGDTSAQLRATLYQDSNSTTQIAICGQGEQQLTVDNTKVQQLRIHFGIPKDPVYAEYSLTVVGYK